MAIKLNVSTPCHENWLEMAPVGPDCRHCASCDRQVVDFTQKTDAELLRYLRQHAGNICGRFHPAQLGRPLTQSVAGRRGGLTAMAAGFAAVLTAQQPVGHQQVDTDTVEQVPAINHQTPGEPLPVERIENDTFRTISGRILDDIGEAVFGAEVLFLHSQLSALTDREGNFSLKIPLDTLKTSPLEIQIRFIGYTTKTVTLSRRILSEDLALLPAQTLLVTDIRTIQGNMIYVDLDIYDYHPPSAAKRVRQFFQKLFR